METIIKIAGGLSLGLLITYCIFGEINRWHLLGLTIGCVGCQLIINYLK